MASTEAIGLFSAQLVVMTVLGGSRHFRGPVAGAFAFPGGLAGTAARLASRWSRPVRA